MPPLPRRHYVPSPALLSSFLFYIFATTPRRLSPSSSLSFSFCLSFSLVFRHISVFDLLATSPSASASEFSFSLTIFLLFLPLSIVPFFSSSLSSSFLLHSRHLTFEKNEYLEYCKKEIRRRLYAAATTSRSSSPISCSQADEKPLRFGTPFF